MGAEAVGLGWREPRNSLWEGEWGSTCSVLKLLTPKRRSATVLHPSRRARGSWALLNHSAACTC